MVYQVHVFDVEFRGSIRSKQFGGTFLGVKYWRGNGPKSECVWKREIGREGEREGERERKRGLKAFFAISSCGRLAVRGDGKSSIKPSAGNQHPSSSLPSAHILQHSLYITSFACDCGKIPNKTI